MSAIARLVAREGLAHGLRSTVVRGVRRIARQGNAAVLGWRGGRLPLGSTVIGARCIEVGVGFDAAQPVWIEAVEDFAGVQHSPVIRIGERFSTSGHLHISAIDRIEIGDDCLFGANVYIGDHAHGAPDGHGASAPGVPPRERPLHSRGPVRIGDRVWLGDGVVVTDGVTIGDGCVIGANSVVTKDVAAGKTAAGAPARPLVRRHVSMVG